MRYEPQVLNTELKSRFEVEEVTPEMAWVLVKLMKHARLRCRNNAALNNYLREAFPELRFDQVEKKKADGTFYEGLQITWRDSARQVIQDDDD